MTEAAMLSKLSASINGIYLVHNEVSDVLFNLNPGTSKKAGKRTLAADFNRKDLILVPRVIFRF